MKHSAGKQLCELIGRDGPAEQVALYLVALARAQECQLLHRFHPLGDDLEAEALGHVDDGDDDGLVVDVMGQVLHEGLVNLELVDLKAFQVGERE